MNIEDTFRSAWAQDLKRFIAFKRMQGCVYPTQAYTLRRFDRFLGERDDAGGPLTMDLLNGYVQHTDQYAPNTRRGHLSTVRQFTIYLHAVRPQSAVLAADMLPRTCATIRFCPLTPEQVHALMDTASTLRPAIRVKGIQFLIGLLYAVGLRIAEALRLNLDDVDMDRATLFVRKSKFGKERLVAMSPSTLDALNEWLKDRSRYGSDAPKAPLLLAARNRRLNYRQASYAFRVLTTGGAIMSTTLSQRISSFFDMYLRKERCVSPNTLSAYSDAMRLLLRFACTHYAVKPEQLSMEMLSFEFVFAFLTHLEKDRGNQERTRNQRLAVIKIFFRFLVRHEPAMAGTNERVQAIRVKPIEHAPPPSLTPQEVDAIIQAPTSTELLGARDSALWQFFYNTGARAQEVADLTLDTCDFKENLVTLTGKGRKRRTLPLWPDTVRLLQRYVRLREQADIHSAHLFLNSRGVPLTRHGIGRRLASQGKAATVSCPSLRDRRVTPHVFRHTTALHLIESGIDITVVQTWLGHADLKTTNHYIEVSIQRKRAALEKAPPPGTKTESQQPRWKEPTIIQMLLSISRKALRSISGTTSTAPAL